MNSLISHLVKAPTELAEKYGFAETLKILETLRVWPSFTNLSK